MKFREVVSVLNITDVNKLPGEESQFKMLPSIRPKISWEEILETKPTMASVMLLIYPKGDDAMFSLILRNSYKGAHSNQVGLPGGKLEEGESDLEAAIRETHEEIGVELNKEDVHFPLSKVWVSPSKFLVTPFVASIDRRPDFILDEFEVQKLIEVSISDLLDDNRFIETEVSSSYVKKLKVNAFVLDDEIVWGATAMMLSEFKDLLKMHIKD